MKPFIITGCGRSGTMGIARLLNILGIRTSFEEFFSVTRDPPEQGFIDWLHRTSTIGEVSGLAPPFLKDRESDVAILHQVRNPIAVMSSLLGLQTWTEKSSWPNVKFSYRWIPNIDILDDPITKSMKYWLEWNKLVEDSKPLTRYRIEDINPNTLVTILDSISIILDLDQVQSKFSQMYLKNINTSTREIVNWQEIPETALKDRMRSKAIEYGYTEEELIHYETPVV